MPGLHFDLLADGRVEVCKEPPFTPACRISSRWLQDVLTVNDDLFIGNQFTRIAPASRHDDGAGGTE